MTPGLVDGAGLVRDVILRHPLTSGKCCKVTKVSIVVHLVGYTSVSSVTAVHWPAGDENLKTFHHNFSSVRIVTWGEMLMSGQAAFLAILILSEREEVAAWAQQLPQY